MRPKSLTKRTEISFGEGKYRVQISTIMTAQGIIVLMFGGEEPHVGSVAIAIPRPSLRDPTRISSTASVYTLVGHKDDEVAKPAAEKLARELNDVVVVIAGIHIEDAAEEEIKILMDNSHKVIEKLLETIKK